MTALLQRTAAVVVNFRTADATIAAARSLLTSDPPVSAIIVVDNGSGDDSSRRVAAALSGVQVIERPDNRGFSAGCNAGIRRAFELGAERILLLNPDAIVSPTAVATMERLLESDPQLGIVGAVVVSKTHSERVESFGISFSATTGRMWNQDSGLVLSSVARPQRRDVDAVSGCAMLVKRTVFERIGMFDEDYFFGFEDIDFCLRARAAGFLTAAAGSAIVEHQGQASIGRQSARRVYFATRNHLLLARRATRTRTIAGRWLQVSSIFGFNLAYVLFSSDTPRIAGLRAFARGIRDHLAGRYQAGQ